ncbi:Immunoglobulin like [Mactra antiquata]
MTYKGIWLITCFNVLLFVHGQLPLNSGCLNGWVSNSGQCYLFVSNNPQIIEIAESECWTYGATLLVVNDFIENQFIKKWLERNDIIFRSTWFTKGYYVNNGIVWNTNELTEPIDNVWNTPPQSSSLIYNRVAYKITDNQHGYRWSLVSDSHPANFICEMRQEDVKHEINNDRDYDYGLGFVNKLNLLRGPEMVTEPRSVLILGEGGYTISLECSAIGNPRAKYTWKHDDVIITTDTDTRYTLSSGRLSIASPTEEQDAGYYQCEAENDIGKILSAIAQVSFGYLHDFSPVKPNDQVGTAFEGVRISCNTPSYKPAVRYGWFKNHNTHNYIFPGHPVHFISQSGYLYFSEVQLTDDRTYFCVVTLVTTEDFVADTSMAPSKVGLGTKLIIREGKTDNNYGPIINTHTFPSPALRGSLVRLECIAYASSPQTLVYKWHRADGQPMIKGTKLSDRNRVLTIPNAPLEAQGNYICTVTRPATASRPGATRSKIIRLTLETRPFFAHPISNRLVDENQDVTWRCKSISRPAATYSWYKDGQLLQNIPGKTEVRGNELIIRDVTQGVDEGMYQCSATNTYGTSFSSGELRVLALKPNFDRFPIRNSYMSSIGGNTTIPCKAEGAPLPEKQWLKNGSPLNIMPGLLTDRLGMTLTGDLVITQVQSGDQGTYICRAINKYGDASNSTFLSVVQGIVIDQPPSPLVAHVNRTEFLFCSASNHGGHLDIMYEWKFNGHTINFKNNPHLILGYKNGLNGMYIKEAQYTHAGKYSCVVRTTLSSDTKSAEVLVRGPPSQPAGVFVDDISVTPSSARVVWTNGLDIGHGSPITNYDIEADTNFEPGQWKTIASDIPEPNAVTVATDNGHRADQRAAVVTDLVPNTSYRFRVRAINEYGRGDAVSKPSVYIKTPSTEPYRAPDDLGGGDGKEGTLTITWTPLPPAEQCGDGIGYFIYWRRQSNDPRITWKKERVDSNVGEFTAIVGVENYYLPYEVRIQAFNDIGPGPNSTMEIVYSANASVVVVNGIDSVIVIGVAIVIANVVITVIGV